MLWHDEGARLFCEPDDFDSAECLLYLSRNPNENLHIVRPERREVLKAVTAGGEPVLLTVVLGNERVEVSFPLGAPGAEARAEAAAYVAEWLDLGSDLRPFYAMAESDAILRQVVPRYRGLRLVGAPNLFEALCWAILGQQISLHVAYLLKRRFVEAYGAAVQYGDAECRLFPAASAIAELDPAELETLRLSRKKSEYIVGAARLIADGRLTKSGLLALGGLEAMEQELTAVRGIGKWTANYVIMRCLRHPDAFPLADVGLHNALKQLLGLAQKPPLAEIEAWAQPWRGWRAYATFYLWRTLQ